MHKRLSLARNLLNCQATDASVIPSNAQLQLNMRQATGDVRHAASGKLWQAANGERKTPDCLGQIRSAAWHAGSIANDF